MPQGYVDGMIFINRLTKTWFWPPHIVAGVATLHLLPSMNELAQAVGRSFISAIGSFYKKTWVLQVEDLDWGD